MKILIDGQTLLTPEINRGIGIYFKNAVENILAQDFTNDFYINTPTGPHLAVLSPWVREKFNVLDNAAYDLRAFDTRSTKYAADAYSNAVNADIEKKGIALYWSPNALMDNVFLPARQAKSCRFAVTIFDLIVSVMAKDYAKHWSAGAVASYKNKLELLKQDYDLFFHISRHTCSDFTTTLSVENKTHVVTPLAADCSFRPHPFPKSAVANDYVVYTGGFDPRKNMNRALEAFALLHQRYSQDSRIRDTKLIVVCVLDRTAKDRLLRRAKDLDLCGKVKLTGFIDHEILLRLYQNARCLFFPSLYEGFGLPVLEGLACGLPVAASNTSSLPEVGGDLAIYFDPYNVDAMANALYRALQEPIDHESRQRRYEYSRHFSWRATALATLQAFAECIEESESEQAYRRTEMID